MFDQVQNYELISRINYSTGNFNFLLMYVLNLQLHLDEKGIMY